MRRFLFVNVAKGCRHISDRPKRNIGDLLWLRDMNKDDFIFVSKELGHEYMDDASGAKPTFPVKGMVFNNSNGRRCVCLTVERANKKIWVPFVISGGSPIVHLGEDCLKALKIDKHEDFNQINVNIHGFGFIDAYHQKNDNRLKDVNILGWEFFRDTNVYESMNPATKSLLLYKDFDHFQQSLKVSTI